MALHQAEHSHHHSDIGVSTGFARLRQAFWLSGAFALSGMYGLFACLVCDPDQLCVCVCLRYGRICERFHADGKIADIEALLQDATVL